MNVTKIRTALHLDNLISKRKDIHVNPEKIVKIIDHSIPGDSYKQLTEHKEEIANFAKEKGLSNIVFYDPRRNLGEMYSGNVESRMANCVKIKAKSESGLSFSDSVDFFSNPKTEFLSKVYEKLSDAAAFFNSPVFTTITIDKAIADNMSRFKLKRFETKVAKAAEKMKLSNVEVTTKVLNDKNSNVLILTRNTSNSKASQCSYFGDKAVSPKKAIAQIKEFEGTRGINSISSYDEV